MGWRQIAAHHSMAKKHAVGGEYVGQAVIRHFGQPAGCQISLDLATVDAPDLHRNVRQGRHLGQAGLGRSTIAGEHVAEIDVILLERCRKGLSNSMEPVPVAAANSARRSAENRTRWSATTTLRAAILQSARKE